MFPAVGNKTDGKGKDVQRYGPGSTHITRIRDGASNSLLVGSVSPDRKIPWSKPEDVLVDRVDSMQGNLAGFAAPYNSAKGSAGVFARADGSVFALLESADINVFRKMLTINDGALLDQTKLPKPTVTKSGHPRGGNPTVLELRQTKTGPVAESK